MPISTLRRIAGTVVAVLITASLAAPPAAAVDDEMGETRAGQYYLRVSCENTDAATRFQKNAIEKFNGLKTWDQARRVLPLLKREAGILATAYYRTSRALINPPAAWPESVVTPVEAAAAGALKVHNSLRSASGATSARGWYHHVVRAGKVARSLPTAKVRAKLDLPPPGRGC